MEWWRDVFGRGEADICSVIENAIAVAASHCPQELMARREGIVQRLYSPRFVRCGECNALTLALAGDNIEGKRGVFVPRSEVHQEKREIPKERKNLKERKKASYYTFDEAETLTEEIEEEIAVVREVERIKEILLNSEESSSQVHECLRRLELMQLSVETLEVTKIGRVVNGLRRHRLQQVCSIAEKLVYYWKELVDIWMEIFPPVDSSIENVCPKDVKDDHNGLLFPPFDQGALLITRTPSIDISEIFAGMDDDGNVQDVDANVNEQVFIKSHLQKQQNKNSNRTSNNTSAHAVGSSVRVMRSSARHKPNEHRDPVQQSTAPAINPTCVQPRKDYVKIEKGKRKLHEEYQLVDKTKKQRITKLLEVEDIPESGHNLIKGRCFLQWKHSSM